MTIDLGIDFEQAEKESRPPLIPDGKYEFLVQDIQEVTTQAGRPSLRWWLQIINRPDVVNRRLPYNTPLPWIDPSSKERDASGLGLLVGVIDAIGARWSGTTLPDKETFFGRTGVMTVSQRPNRNDPEQLENQVRMVSKRKATQVV